jgi:hypothetical protein
MATFHVPGTSFQFAEREQGGTPSPRTMEHDSPSLLVVAGLWPAPAATRLSGWPALEREGRADLGGAPERRPGRRARHQGRSRDRERGVREEPPSPGPSLSVPARAIEAGRRPAPAKEVGRMPAPICWHERRGVMHRAMWMAAASKKTELAIWPGVLGAGMGFRVN